LLPCKENEDELYRPGVAKKNTTKLFKNFAFKKKRKDKNFGGKKLIIFLLFNL